MYTAHYNGQRTLSFRFGCLVANLQFLCIITIRLTARLIRLRLYARHRASHGTLSI